MKGSIDITCKGRKQGFECERESKEQDGLLEKTAFLVTNSTDYNFDNF